jgi:hypothetical protein
MGPVGPAMPALLTITSRPPSFVSTSPNRRATAASSAKSATVVTTPECALAKPASASGSISQISTLASASMKPRAIAAPMPAEPAVTSTRSPGRGRILSMSVMIHL